MTTAVHRNMNQLLLEGGAFSETDLLELLRRCIEAHDSRIVLKGDASDLQTLDNLVSNECSKMLEPLGIKIAKVRNRAEQQMYYGVVNLRSDDPFAQLANCLSTKEQEFFHRMINEMATPERSGKIDAMEAASLGRELSGANKLNPSEAQECLQRLEEGQWLTKSEEGVYSVGIRCELQKRYEVPAQEAS
eukprot:CAMPEP_0181203078 /NCGR_PEP_ID=MMETSP1096-20121128/19190_1 /TAXON_ID=156174 ORGANISM="Chrysochromulina ericina, Strain CCMP281" /NCGR_SAMPLE_ID=MMETSP1096 /ASSEMBLY_ACC=CAM_ASM_000453 /LENGTH=189 /DNA_ID=CAMNT_0023293647 /DNA_START=49 /DNA_END=618 /DNA_ORIENTATION=-